MKLITRDANTAYLQDLKDLLEKNGIPAHIGGKNVARVIPPIALTQPTLWIYLDHQFFDAVNLVNNPSHTVLTGIDVEAFYENQPEENVARAKLNRALLHLGLVMVGILGLMFVVLLALTK